MGNDAAFEMRCLSSLTKVFPDEPLHTLPFTGASALQNEIYSFQVAYRANRMMKPIFPQIQSEIKDMVEVRRVGLVGAQLTTYHDHDEHILRTSPGLYPDPLFPIEGKYGVVALPEQWHSVWVTVSLTGEQPAGTYPIRIFFTDEESRVLGEETFLLEVIPMALPKQTLIHTQWFHTDCIAVHYGLDVFSEEHWSRIDQFIQTAVGHGINMILTPIFTPPLDTAVGGERPTVQLVDVSRSGTEYTFGFDKFHRWIDLCLSRGVEYFEISHLFTQWGAKHAPKIMATVDGEYKRLFGWETDATGKEYQCFLSAFLPELAAVIRNRGLEKQCYFHVSDEPSMKDFESYQQASQSVRGHLKGFTIIDALSNYPFYELGLVDTPIPANSHVHEFIEHGVPNLWTYYCLGQYDRVSNRFLNMPSARNRIFGTQLYKYNLAGFLHWGYNFYFSQYSGYPVDPFTHADGDRSFPAGDPFIVYPGKDGPIDSIRLEVLFEAFQDLRALRLLESIIGRDETLRFLEEGVDEPITFYVYPRGEDWLLNFRERVNQRLASSIK